MIFGDNQDAQALSGTSFSSLLNHLQILIDIANTSTRWMKQCSGFTSDSFDFNSYGLIEVNFILLDWETQGKTVFPSGFLQTARHFRTSSADSNNSSISSPCSAWIIKIILNNSIVLFHEDEIVQRRNIPELLISSHFDLILYLFMKSKTGCCTMNFHVNQFRSSSNTFCQYVFSLYID